ncbi:hypothetical protein BIU88_04260 [Chlorobaculum limnaeum]|uniref:Alpha/beta hydrolase n=1 Tax=Chlorobaculum limnaeum TaxID=274537 RepID=A0A1D8D008_CHLLM|nr:hypothetical protein [Chlorobaculum limnaeum]AOS83423.1 hypothetical protein BIU88_04260 [Chlorobaculum limnaeum]
MPHQSKYIALGGHRRRYIDTGNDAPAILLVFRMCGHSPVLEYPERISEAITDFVFQEPPLV